MGGCRQTGASSLRDGGSGSRNGEGSALARGGQDRPADSLHHSRVGDGALMKKKERQMLAQQDAADLAEKMKQLKEAAWKLRLQKATGQLENPSRLKVLRRDIARVKTYRRALEKSAEAGK